MTREILLAALEGLEARRTAIEEQIRQVKAELGQVAKPRENKVSEAGRQRIADAQRKRWEEYRNRAKSA
jgi:hypothetical protein